MPYWIEGSLLEPSKPGDASANRSRAFLLVSAAAIVSAITRSESRSSSTEQTVGSMYSSERAFGEACGGDGRTWAKETGEGEKRRGKQGVGSTGGSNT